MKQPVAKQIKRLLLNRKIRDNFNPKSSQTKNYGN